MTADGDCFEVAARMVIADPSLTLVHGTVVGQGPIEGVHHAHAWCERTDVLEVPERGIRVSVVTCVDRSNGKDVELPAPFFYRIGQAYDLHRYSADETRTLLLRHSHWGPWHSGSWQ